MPSPTPGEASSPASSPAASPAPVAARAGRRGRWRRLSTLVQVLAAVGGCLAVYGVVRVTGPTLRRAHPQLEWRTLAAASLVWFASYTQLVQLWSSSLPWWDTVVRTTPRRLTWFEGMRVFFVSNLARYVPGAVWQFAGLAAMSAQAGASPVAASMGVVFQQLVLLSTGFVLLLSGAPHLLGAWAQTLDTLSQLVLAALLTAGLIVAGPRALPVVRRWVERIIKRPVPLPTPPPRAFALYVVRAALGWIGYGVAFWIFGRALFGRAAPHVWLAATAYLASYLLGLLAVIAPGGIVVREGALVAQLSGSMGLERAVVLAFASRLWQVGLEVCAAVLVVTVDAVRRRVRASAARR